MNRIELAAKMLEGMPADYELAEDMHKIAAAIREGKSRDEVLDMVPEGFDTYSWLKAEWPRCTLAADTASGVYNSEIPTDADVLKDKAFYDMLSTVEEGETLYGDVSEEWAEKIAAEYGIK
jgi:hypothetical protein